MSIGCCPSLLKIQKIRDLLPEQKPEQLPALPEPLKMLIYLFSCSTPLDASSYDGSDFICSTYSFSTVITQMNIPIKSSMNTTKEIIGMISISSLVLNISLYMTAPLLSYL